MFDPRGVATFRLRTTALKVFHVSFLGVLCTQEWSDGSEGKCLANKQEDLAPAFRSPAPMESLGVAKGVWSPSAVMQRLVDPQHSLDSLSSQAVRARFLERWGLKR